jgi:hypothetical protein
VFGRPEKERAVKLESAVGLAISSVELDSQSQQWTLLFGENCLVSITCPWRVVADNRIAVTDRDHLQKFGLPVPIDSRSVVLDLLRGRRISTAVITEGTGDLRLTFDGGVLFETFTDSSGYESGSILLPSGEQIILMGGGDTATFSTPPRKAHGE